MNKGKAILYTENYEFISLVEKTEDLTVTVTKTLQSHYSAKTVRVTEKLNVTSKTVGFEAEIERDFGILNTVLPTTVINKRLKFTLEVW